MHSTSTPQRLNSPSCLRVMEKPAIEKFHYWAGLPEELKVMILSFFFDDNIDPYESYEALVTPLQLIGNIELARLAPEACEYLPTPDSMSTSDLKGVYKNRTFVMNPGHHIECYHSPERYLPNFLRPPPLFKKWITRIVLQVDVSIEDVLTREVGKHYFNDTPWFLRRKSTTMQQAQFHTLRKKQLDFCQSWASIFPALRHLEISVFMIAPYGTNYVNLEPWDCYKDDLNLIESGLQDWELNVDVPNITFSVLCDGCRGGSWVGH
jgi:hypothetical protein